MPAQLLDGNALSKKLRTEIAARGAIVTAKGVRPGLAVIVVGDNPASQVYVRNKVKACEDVGFHSVLERYSADLGEEELLSRQQDKLKYMIDSADDRFENQRGRLQSDNKRDMRERRKIKS